MFHDTIIKHTQCRRNMHAVLKYLTRDLFQLVQGFFGLQTHFGLPKTQKKEEMMNVKDDWFEMMNQFLEEYLIYFKSEKMLNSKLSHVANLLIRSHLAVTTKSSEWSEMVNCVKVFCFRPNWTLHNEIMVEDFIYNIFQKHQYCQILNFSKVKPTPPRLCCSTFIEPHSSILHLFQRFLSFKQI